MPDTIVITGGSSGLGLALAGRYLAAGENVALIARDAARLDAACAGLIAAHPAGAARVLCFACDVTDPEALVSTFAEIASQLGTPDTVFCNAGVLHEQRCEDMPLEHTRQMMDINFFGAVHTVRAALPHLKRSDRPRIVIIASVAAVMGVYGYGGYCASKHALLGWSESLRYELQPEGIRVQIALPPEFDSPMVAQLNQDRSPENLAVVSSIPTLTLEQATDGIMAGLRGRKFMIVPSTAARLVTAFNRWFPALTRWVADRRILAVRRSSR